MTWNLGYNVDYGYTYGHYREQDPAWLDLCALIFGAAPPTMFATGRLRYLELGCGQGMNLCCIAACHPHMEFVGIDFNPQHIAHARKLAQSANLSNVRFLEANFVDLALDWPADMGRFHYLSAHGIYSWVAPEVARGLVRCIEHAAEPGALVYLSYNTLPGWLSTLPIQHLLRLWQVKEELPSAQAIELGRQRLLALIEANAGMTQVLPGMKARLDRFPQLDRSYLIQEYLHDNWLPRWFDQMEVELAPAKLRYLGTATACDWYLPAILPAQAKAFLAQFSDPIERETMLDVLVNQSFRRDLWARGHVPVWTEEQRTMLLNQRFALLQPPADGGLAEAYKFITSAGEVTGKETIYLPLYEALASGPKTLRELMTLPLAGGETARTLADTLQALGLMLHTGHIALARELKETKPARNLNRAMCAAAAAGAPYRHLIAPAVPWVLSTSDTDLILFALKEQMPRSSSEQLATALVDKLVSLNRGLVKDGQALVTREAMAPRALELARNFMEKTLPLWQRLGVG